jgi:hypothetical protein
VFQRALWLYRDIEWPVSFAAAMIATAFGFLAPGVPLILAFAPLLIALFCNDWTDRFALAAGHYCIGIAVAGYGLSNLGYNWLIVAPAGIVIWIGISWLAAKIGIGIFTVLSAPFVFLPDNLLLVTGSLLPGMGLLGIAIFAIWLLCMDFLPRKRWSVDMTIGFAGLVLIANTIALANADKPLHHDLWAPDIASVELKAGVNGQPSNTTALLFPTEPGDILILGENIFRDKDHAAWEFWCQQARIKQITIYAGVAAADGVSEVHKITGTDCVKGPPVYRAVVGIPGITGDWFPSVSRTFTGDGPIARSQWILCYEAFSLPRWILLGWDRPNFVFVLANDFWTEPVAVNALRRKVAREFVRLYYLTLFFAENMHNITHVSWK